MGSITVDLAAGTVAGAAQLLVGHPFDTIKVKLQSQPALAPGAAPVYTGALDATRRTLAAEGLRGLYRGMAAPLATVAAFNAVMFATRGQMEHLLQHADGTELTVGDQFVAGAGAGVATSLLACPMELIKCRLQAQPAGASLQGAATAYRGPLDVVRHVLAERGAAGLFRGMAPTLVREVTGTAIMFAVYEAAKRRLAEAQGLEHPRDLGMGSLVAAGGLAGAAFWLPVYPADVVKSRLQVDSLRRPQYSGAWNCFQQTLRAQGVSGLYRGFGPALARSVPANGTCFVVYEVARTALGQMAAAPTPEACVPAFALAREL